MIGIKSGILKKIFSGIVFMVSFCCLQSVHAAWISPTSFEDPDSKWGSEANAYDDNTGSYATSVWNITNVSFLYLGFSGASKYSDAIRVYIDYTPADNDWFDIDVEIDGAWIDVWQGAVANGAWQTFSFTAGDVTRYRMRWSFKTNGGTYWVYEVKSYETVPVITLPTVTTIDATSIEETVATLHGTVTDDGGELCQWRFQYGKTASYGLATAWDTVNTKGTGQSFHSQLSGLDNGFTYHFRAEVRNSAGTASGADKIFVTQPVTGWVSPTGFSDPDSYWGTETYAYDDDEVETTAWALHVINSGTDWFSYIHLTHAAISSDKIRFYAKANAEVTQAEVDVFKDGAWTNVYSGAHTDKTWMEATFTQGTVTEARVRFYTPTSNSGFPFELYEFDFWRLETNLTPYFSPAIDDKTVNEESNLNFTVTAIDPNGDPLTYAATGLPAGATFTPATRTFDWTPTEVQGPGSYDVTFSVTDGSLFSYEVITITVYEIHKTKVGNADDWEWKIPQTGDTVPSGTPDNWQWQTYTPGSGRKIPQGNADSWEWRDE